MYVDNDPIVLAHARALLTSAPEGAHRLHRRRPARPGADPRPGRARPSTSTSRSRSSSSRILHFVADDGGVRRSCAELVDALPSGSRLVLSHLTEDLNPENIRAVQRTYTERGFTFVLRSRAEVERSSGERAHPRRAGRRPRPPLASRRGAPVPEAVEAAYFESLDDIEKVRYRDINDVTDADINVYGASGRKG